MEERIVKFKILNNLLKKENLKRFIKMIRMIKIKFFRIIKTKFKTFLPKKLFKHKKQ